MLNLHPQCTRWHIIVSTDPWLPKYSDKDLLELSVRHMFTSKRNMKIEDAIALELLKNIAYQNDLVLELPPGNSLHNQVLLDLHILYKVI